MLSISGTLTDVKGSPAAGGDEDSAPRRGLTHPCGQGPHFFLPQGEASSAPHSLFAAKRERAAGAVQERKRQGDLRPSATEEGWMHPLDPQQSLRKNPPSKKEGDYGGTWFPRQIARGPRCGAALHFRRNAAIVGVSGRISSSCRMTGFPAPMIFLWYRQAAPSRAAKPPRCFCAAPTSVGVDAGSLCVRRPESIESWGPHCATRSGE